MALPRLFAALNARLAGCPFGFATHHFQAFVLRVAGCLFAAHVDYATITQFLN